MSEQQPDEAILNIVGHGEFLMNRYNAKLYMFVGHLATRDNVKIELEEKEDSIEVCHVFSHSDVYDQLFAFVVTHEYPMSLNNVKVPESTEKAFQLSLEQIADGSLDDYFPDDWITE